MTRPSQRPEKRTTRRAEPPAGRRSLKAATRRRSDVPEAPLAWPIPVAGAIAAGWSVAITIIVLMIVFTFGWIATADPSSRYDTALKTATSLWLLAHGTTVHVGTVSFGLSPLLLTLPLIVMLKSAVR